MHRSRHHSAAILPAPETNHSRIWVFDANLNSLGFLLQTSGFQPNLQCPTYPPHQGHRAVVKFLYHYSCTTLQGIFQHCIINTYNTNRLSCVWVYMLVSCSKFKFLSRLHNMIGTGWKVTARRQWSLNHPTRNLTKVTHFSGRGVGKFTHDGRGTDHSRTVVGDSIHSWVWSVKNETKQASQRRRRRRKLPFCLFSPFGPLTTMCGSV